MNFLQLPSYRHFFMQAKWHNDPSKLPFSVREWLCYTGSLTQKLQQRCDKFSVEITQEGWQAVSSVSTFAKHSAEQTAWMREVILKCNDVPVIFAQTILPESTVNNVAQSVLTLGERAIGLWLFPQNPKRISLEWAFDPETRLYARRSYLELHGYPLAIYEFFLPQFSFAPLNLFEPLNRTE